MTTPLTDFKVGDSVIVTDGRQWHGVQGIVNGLYGRYVSMVYAGGGSQFLQDTWTIGTTHLDFLATVLSHSFVTEDQLVEEYSID